MQKRKIITTTFVLLLCLPMLMTKSVAEEASLGFEAHNIDVLRSLAEEASLGFGLAPPKIAEDGSVVPVELKGSLLGKSDKISVFVEKNSSPLAFIIEQGEAKLKSFATRVKFDKTSNVVVKSERGGEIFESHTSVKVINTGCDLYAESKVDDKNRIRTQKRGNEVVIKGIIAHASKTGACRDSKTGRLEEKDYVKQLTLTLEGKVLLSMKLTGNLSTNPWYNIVLENNFKTGDVITVSWTDTNGETGSVSSRLR